MKIINVKDNEELSSKAADIIGESIKEVAKPVLGLATGSTPVRTYEILIERAASGDVSFKDVTTFNLDEYAGLSGEHENSYRHVMNDTLFNHVDINKENTYVPNGLAADLKQECADYEALIADKGPIDLQILGLGINGHIAFNEPGSSFTGRTQLTDLTESTIEANARFFDSLDEVPTEAVTMGIETILEAKQILLLVQGEAKAEILKEVLNGPVTEDVPATALQNHPNVTVITDIEL